MTGEFTVLSHQDKEKKMIISRKVVSTNYTIILEEGAMLNILTTDGTKPIATLWYLLGEIDGVLDVDYDGHFGNNIYLEVSVDHDTKETWKSICETINNY